MYTKLFEKILDSSIWLESVETRIVWITLLAVKDRDHIAKFAAVGNLARRAGVSMEAAQKAVDLLESPDLHKPDQEHEGRRIERVPDGWFVINGAKYDAIKHAETLRSQTYERVRRYRAKKRGEEVDETQCNESNAQKRPIALAVALTTKTKTPPLSPKGEVSFPSELDTPEFREAWSSWVAYRTEAHKKLTPSTISGQLKKLAAWGPATAAASIRQSIEAGWQGLFEPKDDKKAAPAEDDYERMGRFFKKKGLRENALLDQYKETN